MSIRVIICRVVSMLCSASIIATTTKTVKQKKYEANNHIFLCLLVIHMLVLIKGHQEVNFLHKKHSCTRFWILIFQNCPKCLLFILFIWNKSSNLGLWRGGAHLCESIPVDDVLVWAEGPGHVVGDPRYGRPPLRRKLRGRPSQLTYNHKLIICR